MDAHHRVLCAKVRMAMNQRDGAVADADEALRLDPAMVASAYRQIAA